MLMPSRTTLPKHWVLEPRLLYFAASLALISSLLPEWRSILIQYSSSTWQNTLLFIKCFDGRVYFAAAIISTTILLTLHPQSKVRRYFYYLPIILLLCAYPAPLGAETPFAISTGSYQFGILLASWGMRILDRLYLNQPEEAFRFSEDKHTSPTEYTFVNKFFWAVELMVVTRGVGWNWQIKQIPVMPRLSRRGFLLWKANSALTTALTLVVIRAASKTILAFLVDKGSSGSLTPTSVLVETVMVHVFMYASWAFIVYSSLNLAENMFAILFVGLRLTKRWSRPEMWPSLFGNVTDSYSIRRGWGIFWHQNMRRVCQSPSDSLVAQIHVLNHAQTKRAMISRRYLRLLCTFFFSGIIHAGGSIYMTQKQNAIHDGGNILGFVYQGFSLIAEDCLLFILGIDDSKPPSFLRRLIGLAIVHGYGSYATPTLKIIPLARDHGISGSSLEMGVKMVEMGAFGVLKNPFATMIGSFNV